MKIRARLTFWYAAILFFSLLIFGFGTYQEISEQLNDDHRLHPWKHALHEAGEMFFQVGLPAVLLGLLGGWWITRQALTPVAALTAAAEKIHERNLSEQLPRSRNGDELDRLTEVFNSMTARLDGSFQRIREFTLHASHELKTPLTILRGELETALHDEHSTAVQRERLASQIDEIERLTKIVDGLTLLTKADAGQIALNCEPLRLDELVRESVADVKILAQPQNIAVRLDPCDEIIITGDRHRLRQLLLNLGDNAVKYNRPGGAVNFSLQRDGAFASLKISNTGAGLAPELQPRVFERFFRGDASHNSAVDGCGLGLSIAQWIATAHRGEIQFSSAPHQLTTVSVRLPLA
jgi:signal transduction histidine kinase